MHPVQFLIQSCGSSVPTYIGAPGVGSACVCLVCARYYAHRCIRGVICVVLCVRIWFGLTRSPLFCSSFLCSGTCERVQLCYLIVSKWVWVSG